MRTTILGGLLALLTGLGACETDCFDCGPCGMMGGPNQWDALTWNAPGLDEAGRVVVPFRIARSGECGGDGGTPYLLVWDGAAASLELQEQDPVVDSSSTDYDGDRTWAMADEDVSITIERDVAAPGNVLVTFTQGSPAVSATRSCQLDARVDANLSCAE